MDTLPLDCLRLIAMISVASYRAMLLIRRFALSTLPTHADPNVNIKIRDHFTDLTVIDKGTYYTIHYMLNYRNHREYDLPSMETTYCNKALDIIRELYKNRGDVVKQYNIICHGVDPKCYHSNLTFNITNDNLDTGDLFWHYNGILHRDNDKPAIIRGHGVKEWWRHGKQHRDGDQPAIIYDTGDQYWYIDGHLHRENDKPAIVFANGNQAWYKNGRLHRDNDQPARVMGDGSQYWYKNNKLHRDNGLPAIIRIDGDCEWWINGCHIRTQQLHGGTVAVVI
jgi:hypothetical protein